MKARSFHFRRKKEIFWDLLSHVKQTFSIQRFNEEFSSQSQFIFAFRNLCFLSIFVPPRQSTKTSHKTIDTCQESRFLVSHSPEIQFHANWINKLQVDFAVFVEAHRSKKLSNLEIWKWKNEWVVNWKSNSSSDYCLMWFYYFLGLVILVINIKFFVICVYKYSYSSLISFSLDMPLFIQQKWYGNENVLILNVLRIWKVSCDMKCFQIF